MAEVYSNFSDENEPIYLNNEGEMILPTGDYVTRVNPSEAYTQLAKDGKFDELPDTCEFSMPVTLEVFDKETKMLGEKWILGKFRGRYISTGFNVYLGVKLPTLKIDFSEFNIGDVVEVETENFGVFFGMIHTLNERGLVLTFGKQSGTLRMITDVKSIKKIK